MLFTYRKPSNEVILEIKKVVEENYPKVVPDSAKEPIIDKILEENGITDPTHHDIMQAMVIFNYHSSKIMMDILDAKYRDGYKGKYLL